MQHPVVEAEAHEGAELDVRVVGHRLNRIDFDQRGRQRALRLRVLVAAVLGPLVRRVARLLHKVPNVVAPDQLERFEADDSA